MIGTPFGITTSRFDGQIGRKLAAFKQFVNALVALLAKDTNFVFKVASQAIFFFLFDRERTLILFLALAGEDLDINDRAVDSRRADERSVFNVAGLFTKDRAQQFLFSGQLGFALRRNLTDQNRTWLHLGADANDAALVEIAKHVLADVRNVARDLFRSQLRVARFDFELFDVNRSVVVLFHESLGNENRVFKVVTAPGHEGHQYVTTERQFAAIRAGTVGDHLSLRHPLTNVHDRTLVDAGVLVRTLELDQRVDVRRHFARDRAVNVVIGFDDDAFRVDVVDHAVALCNYDRAGVARRHFLHTGADVWRFGTEQRH